MAAIWSSLSSFFANTFQISSDIAGRFATTMLIFIFYFMVIRFPIVLFNRSSDRKIATAWIDRLVFVFTICYNCAPLLGGIFYAL